MFKSKKVKRLEHEIETLKAQIRSNEEDSYVSIMKELKSPGSEFPILIFKLGDRGKGWIPSPAHATAFIEQIKLRKLDERYNIMIFNYALDHSVINVSPKDFRMS